MRFQLKLPTATYTGRYVQYGCQGLCGVIIPPAFPACAAPDSGDFAVAATDDGHVGQSDNPFTPDLGRQLGGDPANYMGPLLGVYFTWLAKTNTDHNGAPILTIAKLPALHDAALAWVEHGQPPDRIIARQRDTQSNIIRSRPVFPYLQRAKYYGTGSIDDASNFVPAQPPTPPHDTIPWAGSDLYTMAGPVAA